MKNNDLLVGNTRCLHRRRFLQQLGGGIAGASILPAVWAGGGQGDDKPAPISLADLERTAREEGEDVLWAFVKQQFALNPELVYLNNGGLGPSPHCVTQTLIREMMDLERVSEAGHERVNSVREKASRFLHCEMDEIALTRNATEGMNIIARGLPLKAGDEVVLTTHEHPGGAMPWLALAKDQGLRIRLIEPSPQPAEMLARIEAALCAKTRVVSVSHVTCTTGLRLPVGEIAQLCRQRGVIAVFDGAQAIGMLPVNLRQIDCDFYVASGHKWLLGPQGTGLLYVRQAMRDLWRPTYVGAYSNQDYDLDQGTLAYLPAARAVEYGTRNTPVIVALGTALDFLGTLGMERVARRGQALAAHLKLRLQGLDRIEILTPPDPESSGSMVTFRLTSAAMDPWQWCNKLRQQYHIRVRPVGEHELNAVRVSTHIYSTFEEVDRLVAALSELLKA